MGNLKSLSKSLARQEALRARNAFKDSWMDAKYKLHPDLDRFEVNVMYVVEVSKAADAAGF
jgi:hypothetical protein